MAIPQDANNITDLLHLYTYCKLRSAIARWGLAGLPDCKGCTTRPQDDGKTVIQRVLKNPFDVIGSMGLHIRHLCVVDCIGAASVQL